MRWCWIVLFCLGWLSSLTLTVSADPFNPKPETDGDLVLPMPNGASMTFRPIYIGEGGKPFSLKRFNLGSTRGGFKESLTEAVIGGSFEGTFKGQPDWLFYLGKYEVTAGQYNTVMKPEEKGLHQGTKPIQGISWFDAQEFIKAYNVWLYQHAQEKMPRFKDKLGFVRLPTEVEWEFAARGGVEATSSQFQKEHPYLDALSDPRALAKYEWFSGPESSHDKLKEIGKLKPNPLSLYDMLGNVSEMTSSLYQLEYYQGRVGGLVSRGGHYSTKSKDLRASLRWEQPIFNPSTLEPQLSPTLGIRLAISAVIIANRQASSELDEGWQTYRDTQREKTPAGSSTTPASNQVGVKLERSREIVAKLLDASNLTADQKQQLEILQASFGSVEDTIKRAETDSAFAWLEIGTRRALTVSALLNQLPGLEKALEIAIKSKISATIIEKTRKKIDQLKRDADERLRAYQFSLEQIEKHEKKSIDKAKERYLLKLKQQGEVDYIRVVNQSVMVHFSQYRNNPRGDYLTQWRKELREIKVKVN